MYGATGHGYEMSNTQDSCPLARRNRTALEGLSKEAGRRERSVQAIGQTLGEPCIATGHPQCSVHQRTDGKFCDKVD